MSLVKLNKKGQEAFLSVNNVSVRLTWSSSVDLDLMAFYVAKDGRVGGVYSERYSGGSFGRSQVFPFIQLSGDDHPAKQSNACEETLNIFQLEEMKEIYICIVNYSDAISNNLTDFSDYKAQVVITDNVGEPACIPLKSVDRGVVALIAKIEEGLIGYKMINKDIIMNMETFKELVPGGKLFDLASKQ